ncbi:hypothetical protein ACI789_20155 [Geodermatophilus sp. SYSU D00965]
MTEPQQLSARSAAPAPRSRDPLPPPTVTHDGTTRPLSVPEDAGAPGAADTEPAVLGFPVEPPEDAGPETPGAETVGTGTVDAGAAAGGWSGAAVAEPPTGATVAEHRLVVLRRADRVAGAALVLAGVAAGLGIWLPWGQDVGTTGLVRVVEGVRTLGSGVAELAGSDAWPALVVAVGGGVLFLLGLVLFRRARTHRVVGVLALLVAEAVTVAVLVALAAAGWDPARLGAGAWCAVAAAVLGLFGALKATLTAPSVTVSPG